MHALSAFISIDRIFPRRTTVRKTKWHPRTTPLINVMAKGISWELTGGTQIVACMNYLTYWMIHMSFTCPHAEISIAPLDNFVLYLGDIMRWLWYSTGVCFDQSITIRGILGTITKYKTGFKREEEEFPRDWQNHYSSKTIKIE